MQKKYKDSLFRGVFSDEKNAISLYNDISDTPVSEDANVSIITLNNDIVSGPINDLGMIVNNKLIVLVEQQSTKNPNMPLRMLMYVAREYEQEIKRAEARIYGSQPIKIYSPEFFVLYNGNEPLKEWCYTQKFSSLYSENSNKINLELLVTVYDINSEQFKKRLKGNSTLSQYIKAVISFSKCSKTTEALSKCINSLIDDNILSEYLSSHTTEVTNMLIYNYNHEAELKAERAEGKAEGLAEGEAKGLAEGEAKVLKLMKEKGFTVEMIAEIVKKSVKDVEAILATTTE